MITGLSHPNSFDSLRWRWTHEKHWEHRLETFDVNLAHSFTKHHDVNSTDLNSSRSTHHEFCPLCISCNVICCLLTPLSQCRSWAQTAPNNHCWWFIGRIDHFAKTKPWSHFRWSQMRTRNSRWNPSTTVEIVDPDVKDLDLLSDWVVDSCSSEEAELLECSFSFWGPNNSGS